MSRKRLLKKERARFEALEERLERLHRQGADEAFLDLAQGRFRDLSPRSAELYGQVVDRTLRRALAGAELPRVERLLSRTDRDARSRPLARLAEAVIHLAAGRLAEARSGLAACTPAAGAPWPPRLTEALAALSDPGSLAPGSGGIEAPGAGAVRRFQWELAAVQEQGFRLPPAKIEELRQATGELRAALPADPALKRLLDAAEEHLRLLAELAGLEKALRRPDDEQPPVAFFLDRVRGISRPLLAAFRDGPPAALLRPLHHALRLRWRALLALAAEQGGATTWASLYAASPGLFALDLESAGDIEGLKAWNAVRELREAGNYRQLARLLGSLSGAEKTPERMARLWSVELWAWGRAAEADIEEREEQEDDELAMPAEPAVHTALVRLGRMAGEISDRLPSEQRPAAARFLRGQLFDLCAAQHFCNHSVDAAAALLRHLPEDPGLLVVALAGAVCSRDVRARRLFADRIASRGAARPDDRSVVLRLVGEIALEKTDATVQILPLLRPLLGEEAWPQALDVVFGTFVADVCARLLFYYEGEDEIRLILRELEVYRPLLAEHPELAVLEAALDCALPGRSGGAQVLRKLLKNTPRLEAALVAFRLLAAMDDFPGAPSGVGKALDHAREMAISRLDLRWRLWQPLLINLVTGASRKQTRLLRDRIQELLRHTELKPEDREGLEEALTQIERLRLFHGAFRRQRARRNQARQAAQEAFDLF